MPASGMFAPEGPDSVKNPENVNPFYTPPILNNSAGNRFAASNLMSHMGSSSNYNAFMQTSMPSIPYSLPSMPAMPTVSSRVPTPVGSNSGGIDEMQNLYTIDILRNLTDSQQRPATPHEAYEMQLAAQAFHQGFGQRNATRNMTECVTVPSSEHVAEIVGRQGCKIKALRAKTNTYIKTPVRGEEPIFVVTGRKEDVCNAKKEILSAADHFSAIRAIRKNGSLVPGPPGDVEGHVTERVSVPYKVVGLVVGPKGATIKRIQQHSHTYIVTPSRDKPPVFEVTGYPENVEKATQEIKAHIAMRTGTMAENNRLDRADLLNQAHPHSDPNFGSSRYLSETPLYSNSLANLLQNMQRNPQPTPSQGNMNAAEPLVNAFQGLNVNGQMNLANVLRAQSNQGSVAQNSDFLYGQGPLSSMLSRGNVQNNTFGSLDYYFDQRREAAMVAKPYGPDTAENPRLVDEGVGSMGSSNGSSPPLQNLGPAVGAELSYRRETVSGFPDSLSKSWSIGGQSETLGEYLPLSNSSISVSIPTSQSKDHSLAQTSSMLPADFNSSCSVCKKCDGEYALVPCGHSKLCLKCANEAVDLQKCKKCGKAVLNYICIQT